jgi:hypothetical protein
MSMKKCLEKYEVTIEHIHVRNDYAQNGEYYGGRHRNLYYVECLTLDWQGIERFKHLCTLECANKKEAWKVVKDIIVNRENIYQKWKKIPNNTICTLWNERIPKLE